jgi:hypothetical protein
MKKLVFVVVLVLVGWLLWRTLGVKDQPAATAVHPGVTATHPGHSEEVLAGARLNSVFPSPNGEYKITFTQEKIGFSEAALSKGGAKVATLSVSDTEANPSARDKFQSTSTKIGEYPAAANGTMGTALLAGNRYQVQVRSLAPTFTAADRETWLKKFKLAQLAEMR